MKIEEQMIEWRFVRMSLAIFKIHYFSWQY